MGCSHGAGDRVVEQNGGAVGSENQQGSAGVIGDQGIALGIGPVIDAGGIAREVGSPRSANVVLVGALSTELPFAVEEWEDAIRRRVPPKTVEANLQAFDAGRKAAER